MANSISTRSHVNWLGDCVGRGDSCEPDGLEYRTFCPKNMKKGVKFLKTRTFLVHKDLIFSVCNEFSVDNESK